MARARDRRCAPVLSAEMPSSLDGKRADGQASSAKFVETPARDEQLPRTPSQNGGWLGESQKTPVAFCLQHRCISADDLSFVRRKPRPNVMMAPTHTPATQALRSHNNVAARFVNQ
jgi:hypothetical protein